MRNHWRRVRIGDVCDVIAGQSPKGNSYNATGNGLPFYQGKKEFTEKYLGQPKTWTTQVTKEAKAGDVLMSVRAPVGPINFSTGNICIGRGLAAIRVHEEIDREFLFYTLLWKQSEISGNEGAVFASINKKQIEAIEIPFPPLPEQKRIVAILDEAFAGIDTAIANTERNLANARELFESYLNSVFSERSEGWIEGKLEDLVRKECSLSYGIVQPGKNFKGGLPVVRPTDLTEKVITPDKLKRIDPSLAKSYSRTSLDGDELLLCVRGSTGVVSIAASELKGANVTRGIVPIRFEPSLVAQELGYYLLMAPSVQAQIAEKTYGAALMQINIRDLRKILILVPPRQKQDGLLDSLDDLSTEVRRLEAIYQQKLTALVELKQSLLKKAFSGELTADAQDEVEAALA